MKKAEIIKNGNVMLENISQYAHRPGTYFPNGFLSILVSTKAMASFLDDIITDDVTICNVRIASGQLCFRTNKHRNYYYNNCHVIAFTNNEFNIEARFDWLRSLLKSCTEQPVRIDFTQKRIEAIFQY